MKTILHKQDVKWVTRHTLDYLGETFIYDNRYYRLIREDMVTTVKSMLDEKCVIEAMNDGLLVKTWVSQDIEFAEYAGCIVLEHEKIDYLSYPYEWTVREHLMAQECVIRLQMCLIKGGYVLSDPHKYNIVFNGCRPVYVDFGSIVKYEGQDNTIKNLYREFHVYPYLLYKKNIYTTDIFVHNKNGTTRYEYLCARVNKLWAQTDALVYKMGIFFRYENIESTNILKRWLAAFNLNRKRNSVRKGKILRFLFSEEQKVKHLLKTYSEKYYWSEYQDKYFGANGKLIPDERFTYYLNWMKQVANREKIISVLEIAGNSGFFSQLLLENNAVDHVCVTDYDSGALDGGILRCLNLPYADKISFANRNILSTVEYVVRDPYDRYKSDVVFALAVTHHLILTQKMKLETIVEALYNYSSKYVVTEFMPLGLWNGDKEDELPPIPDWYTLEWFVSGFKKRFEIIQCETVKKNRIAVILKRI